MDDSFIFHPPLDSYDILNLPLSSVVDSLSGGFTQTGLVSPSLPLRAACLGIVTLVLCICLRDVLAGNVQCRMSVCSHHERDRGSF